MSTETAALALVLDGPLQSWGFASRFERRTTGLHPTKSGVVGMICAAMGLGKGTPQERETLPLLAALIMTSIEIPRSGSGAMGRPLPIQRLEDFHTVLDTRKADGSANKNAVVTRRQYLLDARFGVILEGDRNLLQRVAESLRTPVWGIWLGRKSCIPAAPVLAGLAESRAAAWETILGACELDVATPMERFTVVREVAAFVEGADTINDQPLSFGDGSSSGPEQRRFSGRRIKVDRRVGDS